MWLDRMEWEIVKDRMEWKIVNRTKGDRKDEGGKS